MAKSPSPADEKPTAAKIFDVSKPGKSAATATAKPILVNNHPLMPDPMVTPTSSTDSPDEPTSAPPLKVTKKIVISPIHPDLVAEETASDKQEASTGPAAVKKSDDNKPEETSGEAVKVTVKEVPAATTDTLDEPDEAAPEAKAEPGAAAEEASDETEPTAPSQPAGTSMDTKQPDDPKSTTDQAKDDPQIAQEALEAAAKADAEHQDSVKKLIESKQYYLHVNSLEKRRTKRFIALGFLLIVALAVAWLDVALDAGLVTNSDNLPHSHFFSAKTSAK